MVRFSVIFICVMASSFELFAQSAGQHKLYVNATPTDSKIYITNIKPKFRQGIELTDGKYTIKVMKQGFQTSIQTVEFSGDDESKTLKVDLKVDRTAFSSDRPIEEIYRINSGSHRPAYKLGDSKASLALALLMEQNALLGNYKYIHLGDRIYSKEHVYDDFVLNKKKDLKKDFSYSKKLALLEKEKSKAISIIESKREMARDLFNTNFVVRMQYRMDEEEFLKHYNFEKETMNFRDKWSASFYQAEIKDVDSGGREYYDYVDFDYLSNNLFKKNSYVWGYTAEVPFHGVMGKKDYSFKNISFDRLSKAWNEMKRDIYCRSDEKVVSFDVLVKISDVVSDDGVKVMFSPLQARFVELDALTDLTSTN